MWELWSGCKIPYWQKMEDDTVIEYICGGGRLEKPENCPAVVYEVMLKCWGEDKTQRSDAKMYRFLWLDTSDIRIGAHTKCYAECACQCD
jgi:hypothetical protein